MADATGDSSKAQRIPEGLEALYGHMLTIYCRRKRGGQLLAGHLNRANRIERWERQSMPPPEMLTEEWALALARSSADERYQWAWQQQADGDAATMSRLIGLMRLMFRSRQVLDQALASGYAADEYVEDKRTLRESKAWAAFLSLLARCTDAQLDEIECALRAPQQAGGEARIGRLADGGLYACGVFTRGTAVAAQ